jgi:hypothetical protein
MADSMVDSIIAKKVEGEAELRDKLEEFDYRQEGEVDWTGSPWRSKSNSYYYWMFQCCLLVIIAGLGAWLNQLWIWSPMQGLIVDIGFPALWTWTAIALFDVFR